MPPPTINRRFGTDASSSAPVESTMRGSSGANGRRTDCEPAAMIAFWKRTTFFAPVLFWAGPSVNSTLT